MVRLMLMYYVDFIAFRENPEKTWNGFLVKEMQKAPPEPSLHTRGALLILGSLLCAFSVNDILMSVFKTDTAPMR